jgi:hypothetical protein
MARRRRRRLRPLVGLLAVGALGAGVAIAVRDSDGPPPYPDIPISAWAPYWVLPEAVASVGANGGVLHELSPFWYSAEGATTIDFDAPLNEQPQALIAAARQRGALVLPSIVDGMPAGGMAGVLADPTTRAQHVATIVDLVATGGFDGIDIDYEQFAFADPRSTWETTRPLLGRLHHRTRRGTARRREAAHRQHSADLRQRTQRRQRVLGVRLRGHRRGRRPHPHHGLRLQRRRGRPDRPIDWVRDAVRAAKAAVGDDDKIVLGVPLYGRNWVTGTTGTCPASAEGTTTVTQRTVTELATKRGATPVHNPDTAEASFQYQLEVSEGGVTCTQTRQVHYVDEVGALARIDVAREERIGGVAFWALGFDSDATWAAVAPFARPQPGDTTTTVNG